MRMQIDKTWDEYVARQLFDFLWGKSGVGIALLQNCNNSAPVDRNSMVFKNKIGRFNRNDPAGFDEQVYGCSQWPGFLGRKGTVKNCSVIFSVAYFGLIAFSRIERFSLFFEFGVVSR